MEKVCKRVCFELEQQFSTSIDLWTPKHFPGADSCIVNLDLSTIALLSFIYFPGIGVFFCGYMFADHQVKGCIANVSCGVWPTWYLCWVKRKRRHMAIMLQLSFGSFLKANCSRQVCHKAYAICCCQYVARMFDKSCSVLWWNIYWKFKCYFLCMLMLCRVIS